MLKAIALVSFRQPLTAQIAPTDLQGVVESGVQLRQLKLSVYDDLSALGHVARLSPLPDVHVEVFGNGKPLIDTAALLVAKPSDLALSDVTLTADDVNSICSNERMIELYVSTSDRETRELIIDGLVQRNSRVRRLTLHLREQGPCASEIKLLQLPCLELYQTTSTMSADLRKLFAERWIRVIHS